MNSSTRADAEQLLDRVRGGAADSLGQLLQLYRNYLNLLARTQIDLHLQGRASASDVVQETFLDACRDFQQFRGRTEAELAGWLRRILVCNLARLAQTQRYVQKRDVRREVSLNRMLGVLNRSSADMEAALCVRHNSPSAQARQREDVAWVADQLARLPDDYREVIVLRNLEGLAFAEVARRMGRSTGAVRILWVRALDRFRQLLQEDQP